MANPPSVTGTSSRANAGMGMATMTFSTSTNVTLFFSDWRTNTPAKYLGTLIFIFVVTLLNRFLGAWRNQLGHQWANQAAIARVEQRRLRRKRRRRQRQKEQRDYRRNQPAPEPTIGNHLSLPEDGKDEWQPLSPSPQDADSHASESGISDEEKAMEKQFVASLAPKWTAVFGGRWRAGNPWTFKIDVPRALLEGLRALIGYLL